MTRFCLLLCLLSFSLLAGDPPGDDRPCNDKLWHQDVPPCPVPAWGPFPATPQTPGHPHPQPRLLAPTQTTDGQLTTVVTAETFICPPAANPFIIPPGTNLLPTIYTNAFDGNGVEMPNTLPSTPDIPYNLHDGDPVVTPIDPTSPTDDLIRIFAYFDRNGAELASNALEGQKALRQIEEAVAILLGTPLPKRSYSGFPLLHYNGPDKSAVVQPIKDKSGVVIGGNVDVHQVWYDSHIESNISLIDVSQVLDVPWTVTYTVDVLHRGRDDFSPFVMYTDDPALNGSSPASPARLPHVGMDQTFFPMAEATRTVFKIKMAPGKYFNLSYTWGWRMHPPRVQVLENLNKTFSITIDGKPSPSRNLLEWEQFVFGKTPTASLKDRERAIAMIGDLSPAKRMYTAFRNAQRLGEKGSWKEALAEIAEAKAAFADWRNRTHLPRGVTVDPNTDLTLLYVNNTIYGQFSDGGIVNFPCWTKRGQLIKITLLNGDNFHHGYMNVDFGGARGWENQFKSSVRVAGSGCWFTFGRCHWMMNLSMLALAPADPKTKAPSRHEVDFTYNWEPSARLRFYQFDPLHHDVAIFSVH